MPEIDIDYETLDGIVAPALKYIELNERFLRLLDERDQLKHENGKLKVELHQIKVDDFNRGVK